MKPHVTLAITGVFFIITNGFGQGRTRMPPKSKQTEHSVSQKQNQSRNSQWNSNACRLNRYAFENGLGFGKESEIEYGTYTRQKALNTRQEIMNSPAWDTFLPCCPETKRLASESPLFTPTDLIKEWLTLSCFHPNAKSDFRTSEFFHKVSGVHAGQQCTYDTYGVLIPPGSGGTGTSDFFSPTVDVDKHLLFDVFPWTQLTIDEYNPIWRPDPGCGQPLTSKIDPTITNWLFSLYVRRGDVITISATGRITFDVDQNESGPEGSSASPKSKLGVLGRFFIPPPLATALPGALLGGVYTGVPRSLEDQDIFIKPENLFYVGKGGGFTMPATGYLAFMVNDGYLVNNSGSFTITFHRTRAR